MSVGRDWNVVVTVEPEHFDRAREVLEDLGPVSHTGFYNVLAAEVNDPTALVAWLLEREESEPGSLDPFHRVVPIECAFTFQSPEEFEEKLREAALHFVPRLAGRAFHVRIHRRGFHGRIHSSDVERGLGDVLLETMAALGTPSEVRFEDPDAILVVETIGTRAGLALLEHEDMKRCRVLRSE